MVQIDPTKTQNNFGLNDKATSDYIVMADKKGYRFVADCFYHNDAFGQPHRILDVGADGTEYYKNPNHKYLRPGMLIVLRAGFKIVVVHSLGSIYISLVYYPSNIRVISPKHVDADNEHYSEAVIAFSDEW